MTEIPLPVGRPHPSLLPVLGLKLCACKFSVTELHLQPFLSFDGGGRGQDSWRVPQAGLELSIFLPLSQCWDY